MHSRTALRIGAYVALYACAGSACGGSDDHGVVPADFAEAGATGDGGHSTTVTPQSDAGPAPCGPTAKNCLGGACVRDACMPVVLFLPPTAQVGQGIALDQTSIYWTAYPADAGGDQNGAISTMLLDGGDAKILSAGQPTPARIAVDTFGVYWTSQGTSEQQYLDGTVSVLDKACGEACVRRLSASEPNPFAITSFGGRVYWTVFGASAIRSALPDGGDLKTVGTDGGAVNPIGIAVDATGAYITDAQGFLVTLSPTGDVVKRVAAGALPFGVVADKDNLYWSDFKGNTVFSAPRDGGPSAPFAEAQGSPGVLAQDDAYVYWVNLGTATEKFKDGAIVRRKKNGCVPPCLEILANDQPTPVGIAVDSAAIYWVVATGQVMKLAK